MSTSMAGGGQQQLVHLWFECKGQARKVPEQPRCGNKLDKKLYLGYLRLDPLTIALDDVVNLVDSEGWTKHDIQGLQGLVQNTGITKETAIKVDGDPGPGIRLPDATQTFLQHIDLPNAPLSLQEVQRYISAEPLLFKDGSPVRLPVLDALYDELSSNNNSMVSLLQPLSGCGAQRLSALVTHVLSKPFTQPTDETVLAGYVDMLLWDVWELMGGFVTAALSLKRKRNNTGKSLTAQSLQPDFLLLVRGSLLFKGEDKTCEGDLDAAVRELREKLAAWSAVYHDQVEYLLCYAAAGMLLQFCILPRDSPARTDYLGQLLDLAMPLNRLHAIITAIKLYGVLAQQVTQLPAGSLHLGHSASRVNGTTITYFDRFVEKQVDVTKQPWLRTAGATMNGLYDAVTGCEQLVQKHKGRVKVVGDMYSVFLQPLGSKLDGPPSGAALRAAVKCILLALNGLHVLGWGHGDVRWENVLRLTAQQYVLIDLETALRLNNPPPPTPPYPEIDAWGQQKEALDNGQFTAQSDLYMVGAMLQGVEGLGVEGQRLRDKLLAKGLASAMDALGMAWFAEA